MRIAVLGTGGVGGLYGGWLQAAGLEVHFLARSDAEVLRQEGLHIRSPRGEWHLRNLAIHESPETLPVCDVVLVAWKTTANRSLGPILSRVAGPKTAVVFLQNGLDPEREALPWVKPENIYSGLCFLCCRREAPGRIWHQDLGAITLAQFHPDAAAGLTPELEAVAELLRRTGDTVTTVADWRIARWRKLVWNMAFNGSTTLCGVDTSKLISQPSGEAMALALMREVVMGAAACGIPIATDFSEKMLSATRNMVAYEPSMKVDADSGREMEVEAIYTRPLEIMRAAGYEAPGLSVIEALLRARQLREGAW